MALILGWTWQACPIAGSLSSRPSPIMRGTWWPGRWAISSARTGAGFAHDRRTFQLVDQEHHRDQRPFGIRARSCNAIRILTNAALYRRDRHLCAYCGGQYREGDLSRDHVIPLHRGGRDRWMNVVTACRSCNTLEGRAHAGSRSHAADLRAVRAQSARAFDLQNRRILQDQMEYLMARVPKYSRLHVPSYASRVLSFRAAGKQRLCAP